jgi:hypothetical protein
LEEREMLRSRGAISSVFSAGVAIVVVAGVAAGASALPRGPAESRSASCVAAELPRSEAVRARPGPPPVVPPPAPPVGPPSERDVTGPGGSLTQTIQVTVIGGPLYLPEDRLSVDLVPARPGAARLGGVLPAVEVVDARGTHAGWELRWAVEEAWLLTPAGRVPVAHPRVTLEPGVPQAVHGEPHGLRAGPTCPGAGLLATAAPGAGAGTYAVGATVTVDVPRGLEVLGSGLELRLMLR